MSIQRISVLGGGAWGTALAQTCARAGRDVTLWEFDAGNAEHLASERESRFLPGVGEAPELLGDAFARKSPIDPNAGGKVKKYSSPMWVMVAVVTESEGQKQAPFSCCFPESCVL